MPLGEGWPYSLYHGLDCKAAEVGLDAVPYGSDDCPCDDGKVRTSQAEGPTQAINQSSSEMSGVSYALAMTGKLMEN